MKKKSILKVLLLTLLACCLAFALVACGGTTYTVTYDYNDGGATQSTTIEVDEGSLLEEPTAPTRDGYTFDGWFNGDAEWTFATDTVTGDITLTAHWTQNVTPPPAHTHTYGDYTVTTAPTESAAGVATATCSGCEEGAEGHTTTMALPMLTAENIASSATDGKYTVATTPATCTAAGSSVYTYHYNGDKTLVAATVTLDKLEHTYGDYTVTTAPTADAAGVATATCSGCEEGTEGHTTTMALPMLTAENIASAATDGKYTVATTEATCTAAGSSVYTYHYDGDKTLVAATVTLDKLEHTWGEWTVETLPALDGSTEGAAVRTCTRANCGAEDELTLPKIAFGSSGSPTNYAVGTSEDPTCQKEGYGTLTYTVPEAQGGGTIELRYTLDKVPHSYGTPVYQDSKLTASCTYDCGTTVTATLTFAGGEGATGAAPTQLRVEFDGTSFTVTLPECTFERSGYAFTGWSDGKQTLSGTITLKADDSVTLTATWEATSEVGTAEDFLAALQNAEVSNITLTADITVNQAVVIDRDVTINLNDNTLTFVTAADTPLESESVFYFEGISKDETITATILNGDIEFEVNNSSNGTLSMIFVQYATLNLTNVDVRSDRTGIFVAIATLNMVGGSVTAEGVYAIGTNASVDQEGGTPLYGPVTINITGTESAPVKLVANGAYTNTQLNDGMGVCFNAGGTLTLDYVNVIGARQGVMVRNGTANISNSTIITKGLCTVWGDNLYWNGNWSSGSDVPMAALVIGDTDAENYVGNAIVTIENTEVIVETGATADTKYIYLWADTADGTAAKLVYACDDAYMSDLAEAGKIVRGNPEAEVTVTHAALTHYDAKEATCTEAGNVEYFYCETCDTYFDSAKEPTTAEALVISALGHTYGEWTVTTNPSESAAGEATITCSVCAEGTEGHTQSVTLPKLMAENVAEEATAGKYTVVDTPATCEAEGSTVYTYHFMFDGELMSLELPAIEHEQLEHVWNVTYENTTLTASCQNGCGDSYTATLTLTGTGATVALGEAATFTVADGFAIDLPKLSVTKEEADVIRAYIANGSIVTGTQTVAANGTLALEVVVEDTSFTVGTDGSQDSGAWSAGAWYVPVWTSVIQKGEVVKVEGALKSRAQDAWEAMYILVYSTSGQINGALRADNYILDNTSWLETEHFTIAHDTFWDFDNSFLSVLADCSYVITYDWTDEAVIAVTIALIGENNAGEPQTNMIYYTIKAEDNAQLKDWYYIGLGYEYSYFDATVERCDGQHGTDDVFCSVCNKLNKEAIDALATTSAEYNSGVALTGSFVYKATITGNTNAGVFWEWAINGASWVDVQLCNYQGGTVYFNAWGAGTEGYAAAADKLIMQYGTRPSTDVWSGTYNVYGFRDENNNAMLYIEYIADGSDTVTYAASVYLMNWVSSNITFNIVNLPAEASVTVMTGTIPAQS